MRTGALVAAAVALSLVTGGSAQAAAKKKPASSPKDGKRVLLVAPVPDVSIEMPDSKVYNFGPDFEATLWKKLHDSGKFLVATELPVMAAKSAMTSALMAPGWGEQPHYDWHGTHVPAARLSIEVDAMTFSTGSRGERMFYGFDDRLTNEFNDGKNGAVKNEFPLKKISIEPNYFGRLFDEKGDMVSNTHTGLDIGDGFGINVFFVWLALKYAVYKATLSLRIKVDAPLALRHDYTLVQVKGSGFYFDLAGAYKGYSAGISVARRDAMLQAFKKAIAGAYGALERSVLDLPLTGMIDSVLPDGTLLLGTGLNSGIKPGVLYEIVGAPGLAIRVTATQENGAAAAVVRGDKSLARPGRIIRQIASLDTVPAAPVAQPLVSMASTAAAVVSANESIDLDWKNLPKSDLSGVATPDLSLGAAILKSIVEGFTLFYRIWRYAKYDQTYQKSADGAQAYAPGEEAAPPDTIRDWVRSARREAWAKQIGLTNVPEEPGHAASRPPVVAVIDSGVDYNHSAIHGALWLNPNPYKDARGNLDRYGWDFISGDSRPFDDSYHGTQVASLVTAVMPGAHIMPLKVFNPWGITNSASIYGAFVYAADHGAKIILCGWATQKYSRAIETGVAYARQRGAVVIAAAGDRGDDLGSSPAYPAVLSLKYDNVVTVTGVDENDRLVQEYGWYANYSPESVTLAAPGRKLRVAEPRDGRARATSTGLAAAITSGALARMLAANPSCTDYQCLIALLKSSAQTVPALAGAVKGGLRVVVRD